jgi:co-chaperonin GroES (HSP10)
MSSQAWSIQVSGGKVYIAGKCDGSTCLWTDGVPETFPGLYLSEGQQVLAVSNGDVYLAGTEAGTSRMAYLRNGEVIAVGSADGHGVATAIAVRDGKVHLLGSYSATEIGDQLPVYVVDGSLETIAGANEMTWLETMAFDGGRAILCGSNDAATAICYQDGGKKTYDGETIWAAAVNDGALYLTGSDADGACFWEDGDKTQVDGSEVAVAASIGFDGDGGVAVVGSYRYGSDTRRAWYFTGDDETVFLEEDSARASDIWVEN